MTNSVSLEAFAFSLYSIDKDKKVKFEDDATDPGCDLVKQLLNFLKILSEIGSVDELSQQLLKVRFFKTRNRSITGLFDSGDFGYESNLLNIESSQIAHQRRINEAELLPLYFSFTIPRNVETGVLLLQRTGVRGVKTALSFALDGYFSKNCPGYRFKISPLILKDLIAQYLKEGHVNSVRFIKYNIPKDLADQFDHDYDVKEGSMEIIIKARRKGEIPVISRIKDVLEEKRKIRDILVFEGYEYDNVKIQVEVGGKTKTLDLEHPSNLKTRFDITKKVERGKDGHPTFESMDNEAREIARGILNRMGIRGVHV